MFPFGNIQSLRLQFPFRIRPYAGILVPAIPFDFFKIRVSNRVRHHPLQLWQVGCSVLVILPNDSFCPLQCFNVVVDEFLNNSIDCNGYRLFYQCTLKSHGTDS